MTVSSQPPLATTSAPAAAAPQRQRFADVIGGPLRRRSVRTVQVNVGKRCNQACVHCHVDAGPRRTEIMGPETVDQIIRLLDRSRGQVTTLDLTGGAPELLPDFRRLVLAARAMGMEVIDRCNLTVLSEVGQEDTARFLADNQVQVVASLPCYSERLVERQRGKGAFALSVAGLRTLNALGYGRPGSRLTLNLVYNPSGAALPPAQAALEGDYKRRLLDDFGVVFNGLFTITNMPISRFYRMLAQRGELDAYRQLLRDSHNPATVAGLMCRDQLSISWDGRLYDCDFNQMLQMPIDRRTIFDLAGFDDVTGEAIVVADHCFACTAGAGSSCAGALR